MTKEQQQHALDEARKAGIDLDLLDLNLSLSVAERWRQHDEALALVEKLEAAGVGTFRHQDDLITASDLRAIEAKRRAG
ncbi:MAG: hypothetical protein QM691_06800 [Opitutaceae bacterium]